MTSIVISLLNGQQKSLETVVGNEIPGKQRILVSNPKSYDYRFLKDFHSFDYEKGSIHSVAELFFDGEDVYALRGFSQYLKIGTLN